MAMDVEIIAKCLPVQPDEGAKAFVRKNWNELGGFVTIFKRVAGRNVPSLYGEPQTGYFAECWCSECGETWHTAWGGDKSLIVADGDDGMIYPISPDAAEFGADLVSRINDGNTGICPMCGEGVTFRHISKFGARRMTRRHFLVFRNILGCTALVSWLACREIYPDHTQHFEIVPWVANVIDEQGRLRAFRYDEHGWHRACGPVTPETTGYLSGEGYYGYVRGGFVELPDSDLAGETGEKTGVREYLEADGCFPTDYLRIWRKHKSIENLMKSGFSGGAAHAVNNYASGYGAKALDELDLTKQKPHEILRMSKSEFRHICSERWGYGQYSLFLLMRDAGMVGDVQRFSDYWQRYKDGGLRYALNMANKPDGLTMEQIDRYLVGKLGLRPEDLHLLGDTWRMHRLVYLQPPRTQEELWPRNLMERHDQLSAMAEVKSDAKQQAAFDRTAQTLAPLIWTDGELCIVIPTCSADLSREGRVLRHCVGGYSHSHVSGSPVLFVRHRRRPERPYYTLNICLTGDAPRRLQLHGYGNERHGDKKQYEHTIPKKVLDFCDRWEREVLAPWWAERQRKEVTA